MPPMSSYPSNFSSHQVSRRTLLAALGIGAASAFLRVPAFAFDLSPDWTTPLDPFRIAGNFYYVGSRDLASYLVVTPQGHILINSNLVSSPPLIRASVEKLGFHFKDIKILLLSQAHYDHCAGAAAILKETGARYMVMDGDVEDVKSGGKANFFYGSRKDFQFPEARVDRILHDGDTVSLGDSVLAAHKTAGHTMGCTTWTMKVQEGGKNLNTVIVGGPTVLPGYNLIDDKRYPRMAADYAAEFRLLKSLPCDLFLGAHGGYFDLLAKLAKSKHPHSGGKEAVLDVLIDPAGYQAFVAESQHDFEAELKRQQAKHAASTTK